MDTANIIRSGDTIIVTVPPCINPKEFAEILRKQFPGVGVSVITMNQEEIRVVAHYRPGRV